MSPPSSIPNLYATERTADPTVHARYSHALTGWQWFVLEWDGVSTCFGLVKGFETELGYFDLRELEAEGAALDLEFKPMPLSAVRQLPEAA